jgi:hypothetical protein
MFYVIECEKHVDELFQNELNSTDDIFIHIVQSQPHTHLQLSNKPSLIYLFQLNTNKGYILCINHNETFKIDINYILEYISKFNVIYCIDRPSIYLTIPELRTKLVDLSIVNWLLTGKKAELVETTCHNFYEKLIGKNYLNVNEIIPVSKHYEILEDFKNKHIYTLTTQYKNIDKKIYRFYLLLQDALTEIENTPIGIDIEKFSKFFTPNNTNYSVKDNQLYSKYHFFTLTSRPQNHFNGINFNSLPKDNNCRESFVPLNDIFIEIDFNAYHVQLLSHLIGHTFNPDQNIYDQLLEDYTRINPNINTREESKKLTLVQINNGVSPKYQNIEFFVKYSNYVEQLWSDYNSQSNITDPITGRNIVYLRSDISKHKLVSYMLQSYETSNNIKILYTLIRTLKPMKSKVILYNYDSFLIDACREEFKEIINNIIPIINQNKYVINISIGKDYNSLRKLR